jgi:hypothetical protein
MHQPYVFRLKPTIQIRYPNDGFGVALFEPQTNTTVFVKVPQQSIQPLFSRLQFSADELAEALANNETPCEYTAEQLIALLQRFDLFMP